MKIAFVGSHSTGKSSGAMYLGALLKQKYPHKSVKILEENVRKVSRQLNNELNTPNFQKMVIIDQLLVELEASSLHNIVICDRTTIDPLIYAAELNVHVPNEYVELALYNLDTFDVVFLVRPDTKDQTLVDDGFRDTNIVFRNQIDKRFVSLLKNRNKVVEIKTSQVFNYNYLQHLKGSS